MAPTHEIVSFLADLLDAAAFADYGPNGLQVPGRTEVDRVVTGVSASLELFERAVATDAGVVLVHHGVFWDMTPRALTPAAAARLRTLLAVQRHNKKRPPVGVLESNVAAALANDLPAQSLQRADEPGARDNRQPLAHVGSGNLRRTNSGVE